MPGGPASCPSCLSVCLRVPFSVAVGHRRDRRPRTLARLPVPSPIRPPSPHIWQMSGRRDGERGATDRLSPEIYLYNSAFSCISDFAAAERLRSLFGPTDEGVQFTEQSQILLWGQILSQRFSFLSIASGGQYGESLS